MILESGSTRTLASYPIYSIATDRPFVAESIGLPPEDSITTWKEFVSYFDPGFFNIPISTAILGLASFAGFHSPSIRLLLRNAFDIVSMPVLEETEVAALNFALFPSVTYVFYAV